MSTVHEIEQTFPLIDELEIYINQMDDSLSELKKKYEEINQTIDERNPSKIKNIFGSLIVLLYSKCRKWKNQKNKNLK